MVLFLLSPALAQAGDALTQSLEHETSHGTVADRQEPSPPPAPTPNHNVLSDKAADNKIHYHDHAAKRRRHVPPSPSPTAATE